MIQRQLTKEQRDYIRSERDKAKRKRLPLIRRPHRELDVGEPQKASHASVEEPVEKPVEPWGNRTKMNGELTERQKEILHLISVGWPYPNIARAIEISFETVNDEAARIRVKLQVDQTILAVCKAIRLGMLDDVPIRHAGIWIGKCERCDNELELRQTEWGLLCENCQGDQATVEQEKICTIEVKPDVLSWLEKELPIVPEFVEPPKGGQWPNRRL